MPAEHCRTLRDPSDARHVVGGTPPGRRRTAPHGGVWIPPAEKCRRRHRGCASCGRTLSAQVSGHDGVCGEVWRGAGRPVGAGGPSPGRAPASTDGAGAVHSNDPRRPPSSTDVYTGVNNRPTPSSSTRGRRLRRFVRFWGESSLIDHRVNVGWRGGAGHGRARRSGAISLRWTTPPVRPSCSTERGRGACPQPWANLWTTGALRWRERWTHGARPEHPGGRVTAATPVWTMPLRPVLGACAGGPAAGGGRGRTGAGPRRATCPAHSRPPPRSAGWVGSRGLSARSGGGDRGTDRSGSAGGTVRQGRPGWGGSAVWVQPAPACRGGALSRHRPGAGACRAGARVPRAGRRPTHASRRLSPGAAA